MSFKNVTFGIPENIQQGLSSGIYERFGGIIRNSSNKQIVAHLKETSTGIDQGISHLAQIGSISSILNVGISIIGFSLVLSKLNQIEQKIDQILSSIEEVSLKIDWGYRSKFINATKKLQRILMTGGSTNKEFALNQIAHDFGETHEIFKNYYLNDGNSITAPEYFYTSVFSGVGQAIAHLELNELNEAYMIMDEVSNFSIQALEIYDQKYNNELDSIIKKFETNNDGDGIVGAGLMTFGGGLIGVGLAATGIGIPLALVLAGTTLAGGGIGLMSYDSSDKQKEAIGHLNSFYEGHHESMTDIIRSTVGTFYEIELVINQNLSWQKWKNLKPKFSFGNNHSEFVTVLF